MYKGVCPWHIMEAWTGKKAFVDPPGTFRRHGGTGTARSPYSIEILNWPAHGHPFFA